MLNSVTIIWAVAVLAVFGEPAISAACTYMTPRAPRHAAAALENAELTFGGGRGRVDVIQGERIQRPQPELIAACSVAVDTFA